MQPYPQSPDTLPDRGIAAGRSLRPCEPESCAVLCQGDFAARTKRCCCAKSRASFVGILGLPLGGAARRKYQIDCARKDLGQLPSVSNRNRTPAKHSVPKCRL